jgi:hypothetical protein
MTPRRAIFAVLASAGLACAPDAGGPGASAQAIVGGQPAGDAEAVVALVVRGALRCSGTLISPTAVLTAAHCLPSTPSEVEVRFGPRADAPTSTRAVTAAEADPAYVAGRRGHDLGLLRLAAPAEGVAPWRIRRMPIEAHQLGQPVRHYGYGFAQTDGGGAGERREVSYPLRELLPLELESGGPGQQTCGSDSGGPAVIEELIAGVVSWGDSRCRTLGYDARVDVGAEWIDRVLQAWAEPPPALPTVSSEKPRPEAPAPEACGGGAVMALAAVAIRRKGVSW